MIKIILICTFLLTGCNTIHGVGNDLQDAGMGIQHGIKDIKDTLHI